MLKDFLPFFYVFSNVKGIMRKISLRSFSHNVLFIPHAVFFEENKENVLSAPGLALNNRTQRHKGFLKGIFRYRYRLRYRYRYR